MEPNKLEIQFKEQLDSREIKPSELAWSKLDTMLTATEKPKAKFPWLFIAASFVGLLLIGTVFFNPKRNIFKNQENVIVIQKSVAPKTIVVKESTTKIKKEDEKSMVTDVFSKSTSGTNKTPILKEKSIVVYSYSSQNQVVEVSVNNQKSEPKTITSQTNAVSVDELLASIGNASKKENQLIQKPGVQVNASNLLLQVDGELELSFREKVINKVNKNYQTVKVALTNRNLE